MSLTLGGRAGAGEGLAVFPRLSAVSHREVGLGRPAWRCARSLLFETGLPDSQEAEKATKPSDN